MPGEVKSILHQPFSFAPPSRDDDDDDRSASSSSARVASSSADDSHNLPVSSSPKGSKHMEALASGEAMAARRSKIFVVAALVLAAGIGALIYFLTANEQWAMCQAAFDADSKEVTHKAHAVVETIFGHVSTVGTALTSHALKGRLTFPNVTLPNFDMRTRDLQHTIAAPMVLYAPMVRDSDRNGWETYASEQNWIEQDLQYRNVSEAYGTEQEDSIDRVYQYNNVSNVDPELVPARIFPFTQFGAEEHDHDHDDGLVEGMKAPLWQLGLAPTNASIIKIDLLTNPTFKEAILTCLYANRDTMSGLLDVDFLLDTQDTWRRAGTPRSAAVIPVKNDFYEESPIVGVVFGTIPWSDLFKGVLPRETSGIVVVVNDPCSDTFAFLIEGDSATFLGFGSADSFAQITNGRFQQSYEFVKDFRDYATVLAAASSEHRDEGCKTTLTFHSTQSFDASCQTNLPAIYTSVVVLVFVVATVVFALYDSWVTRRQRRVLSEAQRADAIVSSLFPQHVQQRMMEEARGQGDLNGKGMWKGKLGLDDDHPSAHGSKHIADLYAESTVLFADIVGFTQWSSCRVPSEVFSLLEAIFAAFDEIAHHRGVYKVETVGDCYVAACGVPDPRKDHAVTMGRFGRDCLVAFNNVVRELESELGPDTGELGIRVGIHSGPVTAGVLRGERSRFQLFGDTMNTCARIESTGEKNKIHISHETAEILKAYGKGHWCRKREDAVMAKGKGVLSTYWLEAKGDTARSTHSSSQATDDDQAGQREARGAEPRLEDFDLPGVPQELKATSEFTEKTLRLARWNADILARTLCEVIARRDALHVQPAPRAVLKKLERDIMDKKAMTLDEVKAVIEVPPCDAKSAVLGRHHTNVELTPVVTEQLQSYLMTIALLYRDNAFHGFEHASHVTMSVVKLFHRVIETDHGGKIAGDSPEEFADHTYGIASDPLTRFAVVFSALIHDVDHKGVPNSQLARENDPIALAYNHQSPAEQNSVDIAWSLLMQDEYQELRSAIYSTPEELAQFRQMVVNAVLATDIMDKKLSQARKARWAQAFSSESSPPSESAPSAPSSSACEDRNRKATIVLEHLIQASDVAHTMQHWNLYRKWNTLFFEESYKAFLDGRADTNPADHWYEGELGFFDYYIVPLAKKLKECGVFGASSDEYLDYAVRNRNEWEDRGHELVEEMVGAVRIKFGNHSA